MLRVLCYNSWWRVSCVCCVCCVCCVWSACTHLYHKTHSTKCIIFHQKSQPKRYSPTTSLSLSHYPPLPPCFLSSLSLTFSSTSLSLTLSLSLSLSLSHSLPRSLQPQISHNIYHMWAVCVPHSAIFSWCLLLPMLGGHLFNVGRWLAALEFFDEI